MRKFMLPLMGLVLLAVACGPSKGDKKTATVATVGQSLFDSLKINPDLGEVISRNYVGEIPAADCPGIIYDITLFNQEHSGDGVFALKMTYLEAENGKDMTFESAGRWFTLRGNSTDPNATIYQLMEFGSDQYPSYVLYLGDSLEMLDADQARITSGLNYTLTLRK